MSPRYLGLLAAARLTAAVTAAVVALVVSDDGRPQHDTPYPTPAPTVTLTTPPTQDSDVHSALIIDGGKRRSVFVVGHLYDY